VLWCKNTKERLHHVTILRMPNQLPPVSKNEPKKFSFTARLSPATYDALVEIQYHHRRKTGRNQPLWHILDAAILAYAEKLGIKSRGE